MGHQGSGGCAEEFLLCDPSAPEPDGDPFLTWTPRDSSELKPNLVFLISNEVATVSPT